MKNPSVFSVASSLSKLLRKIRNLLTNQEDNMGSLGKEPKALTGYPSLVPAYILKVCGLVPPSIDTGHLGSIAKLGNPTDRYWHGQSCWFVINGIFYLFSR